MCLANLFIHNQAKLNLIKPLVTLFKKKDTGISGKVVKWKRMNTSRASHYRNKQKSGNAYTHFSLHTSLLLKVRFKHIHSTSRQDKQTNIYEITDNSICLMHFTRHSYYNRKNNLFKLKTEYITLNNNQN